MFQIVRKQEMAKGTIIRFDINAPKIAKKVLPGQFVIVRVNETGESAVGILPTGKGLPVASDKLVEPGCMAKTEIDAHCIFGKLFAG